MLPRPPVLPFPLRYAGHFRGWQGAVFRGGAAWRNIKAAAKKDETIEVQESDHPGMCIGMCMSASVYVYLYIHGCVYISISRSVSVSIHIYV